MGNITNAQTINNPFIYGASADVTNVAALYAPAELGAVFYNNGNKYQRCLLDSAATAGSAVGAVVANQTAYWVSKINKTVTNDKTAALGGTAAASRNAIAGIFRTAVTAGYYCDVLQKGNGIQVASDGAGAIGGIAVSDTTAATARVTAVAIGTAPTVQAIGLIRAVASGGNITVDVDVPSVD